MTITPIIGLEIHVELKTKSKMFCGCRADHFHVDPNTHTCPVCLGLPGALPVPNKTAIDWCLKLGLALGCSVNKHSFFERKNYFYPDLPKGYQISQYQKPFTVGGQIDIDGHTIRINRVHMEEDTGKSVHLNDLTLLDYNRSGVPLVEIVSEPDIISPEMAKKYLNKIQQIIRYLGISDADIEKGSMRCEPTVNLKIETGQDTIYTPLAEIKNIASLTGVMTAIQFEIDRQYQEWQQTGITKSSSNKTTRGWDADKNQTFLQREKEGSADYRYFPEPDIPPFEFTDQDIEVIRATIPELPQEKIIKYKALNLSDYDAEQISDDKKTARFFEETFATKPANVNANEFAKGTANMINGPIKTYLNETQFDLDKIKTSPPNLGAAVFASLSGQISWSTAKENIIESCDTGEDIVELAKKKGQLQVSDTSKIEELGKQVIATNPKAVDDYHKNPNSIGFLVGQLMKLSSGSANPQLAREILEKLLKQ